jgi:hypothetical protein
MGVQTILCEQIGVGTAFEHATSIQVQDLMGSQDDAQAVGNYDTSLIPKKFPLVALPMSHKTLTSAKE